MYDIFDISKKDLNEDKENQKLKHFQGFKNLNL